MSRIGKNPVVIPEKVTVEVKDKFVKVKGPKGELEYTFTEFVNIELKDKEVLVTPVSASTKCRSLWGTTRTLINNMVTGVSVGFSKDLEYKGVGYKAAVKGKVLVLNLGFSHPIDYDLPEGIQAKVQGSKISISGCSKELVGFAAAQIRSFRPPEPYKGKGVKYVTETIIRKAGKTGGK